jgi:hypothetical protein
VREKSRLRVKGRSTSASFISLPHFVLRSAQWAALSGSEVKLLMEIAGQYRGFNNGALSATFNGLRKRGWVSNDTLRRALKSLEAAGWLIKTRQGGRHVGCSLFGISWWPIDECEGKHDYAVEHKASHLWKKESARPTSSH